MKAFTDLEQSKKLAEILPLESADMHYGNFSPKGLGYENKFSAGLTSYIKEIKIYEELKESYKIKDYNGIVAWRVIPCWSLAALYGILPNNKKESTTLSRGGWRIEPIEYVDNWWCEYEDDSHTEDFTVSADNPVDACVAMIIKLHELNLL